jgi:DNA polymerase-3 subunit alpha
MARRAAELGQPAMAITDHGNMHGAIAFYDACVRHGVKPIIGCEIYTGEEGEKDSSNHLILLAADSTGYRNLNQIVSQASLTNFYRKPRVSREMLASWREGIIVLSGCLKGDLAQAILTGGDPYKIASWYKDIFGDRYYIEIHNHGIPAQARVKHILPEIAKAVGARVVVAQDSHFVNKNDHELHEVLLAVQTGGRMSDPGRFRFDGSGYHITSEQEMREAGWPLEWLEESGRIAARCDLKLDLGKQVFPKPPGIGDDEDGFLRDLSYRGAASHYGELRHKERLDYELETISRNGFTRYFLIVADICKHSRSVGIRNSARGSVGGSLVAYCLGIVPVDPMRFGLSFERFLNDGRSPDIDLDFEDARRGEIIEYVSATYGRDRVAQIVTFSEIGGRMALRDVGRALGMDASKIDSLAKAVPLGMKLADAVERPELKAVDGTTLMKVARQLEGTIRHAGKHAAGVVIAGFPLVERTTLMRDSAGSMPMVGLDMSSAERAGLIKFDLLGLKTLSTVSRAVALIEARHGGLGVPSIDMVPEDEDRVWQMLGRGDSIGVFQVESPGMRRVLREMKPARVEHLQAAVALYRPGPMDSIKAYCARRHGVDAVTYLHPALEPVLSDTYGLVVYQEAIMQIANRVAGMTPYESDQFLGAVRKKNPEKLRIYEPKFKDGLGRAGMTEGQISRLWDEIVPFANYGFNQAHAAAYGWLAYQTAWLKAVWPHEFYAALMTQDASDSERIAVICHDARQRGIRVYGPSINESDHDFSIGGGGVRFGLSAVKYAGKAARDAIIAARQAGKFTSIEDFIGRVPKRTVNKRVLEALAKAGALDCIGSRKHVQAAMGLEERDLLGRLEWEREIIGLAVSADPLAAWRLDDLGRDTRLADISMMLDEDLEPECVVGLEIMSRRDIVTKTGKAMAICSVRDETTTMSMSVFHEALGMHGGLLVPGAIIMGRATPNRWNGEDGIVLKQAWKPNVDNGPAVL